MQETGSSGPGPSVRNPGNQQHTQNGVVHSMYRVMSQSEARGALRFLFRLCCFFPADSANANASHAIAHEKSGIDTVFHVYYVNSAIVSNSFKDLLLKKTVGGRKDKKKTDKNVGKRKGAGKRDLHMKI